MANAERVTSLTISERTRHLYKAPITYDKTYLRRAEDIEQSRSDKYLSKPTSFFTEIYYRPRLEEHIYLFDPIATANMAHLVMLCQQRIISVKEARKMLIALRQISRKGTPPKEELSAELEGSVYPIAEAMLIESVGDDTGGKLHTGRSRGDIECTAERLVERDRLLNVFDAILGLNREILQLSSKNIETVMPSYTHLQHAQPMTFGFYLLSFSEAFETDVDRLEETYCRLNRSPAEIGVGMTTGFPVDREIVARLLGFDGLIENALYAHRSMDVELEILSNLSMISIHLYRLLEDFEIWCSQEFDMISLGEGVSGGSTSMAQKRNPSGLLYPKITVTRTLASLNQAIDLSRSNSSEVIPKSYAGPLVNRTLEDVSGALKLTRHIMSTLVVHKEKMRDVAGAHFAQATELVDTIVRKSGLSFRTAYKIVKKVKDVAVSNSKSPQEINLEMLNKVAKDVAGKDLPLSEKDIKLALNALGNITSRKVIGGPAPEIMRRALSGKAKRNKEDYKWLRQRLDAITISKERLEREVDRICKPTETRLLVERD